MSLYPEKGYDQNNYPARMIRPTIAVAFCNADCPGILITYAEVEFLLAEAASKGWNVSGSAESHYEEGIRASMQMMNNYYDIVSKISDDEINDYIAANPLGSNPRESINTQAWILHLTNPSEGWANLRRSDYPAIAVLCFLSELIFLVKIQTCRLRHVYAIRYLNRSTTA